MGRGPGGGGGHGPMGFGRPVEKPKDFRGTLTRLVRYLAPRRGPLLVVFLFAALSTVFAIISPKVLGKATTRLFVGLMMKLRGVPGATIDFAYIRNILIGLGVLYVGSALFGYIQQYIMAGLAQGTVYDMRRDVSDKLSRLPLKYFDGRTHGEILSRVVNDVDNISNTLQQSLTQLITSVVTLVGVVAMMLTISPVMTLITLVTLPLSVLVTVSIARRSQTYFAGQQKTLGELNGHVEEMYTGHRIVKAFGHEDAAVREFEETNDKLYDYGWKAQFVSGVIMPLMNLVGNIGYVIICVVGGIFVTRRAIELGDIQAFIQYSRQFTQPIVQTANIANILQSTMASAERVFEILDETEEIPDAVAAAAAAATATAAAAVIPAPRGEIRFEDVDFRYKDDVPLIDAMNIDVRPGQTVAIVGPTGAGKTTLVNLLMRFYEVGAGRITVDGVDIRDLPRGDLRTMFGMVLQDTWLFGGTVRENIAYGRAGATEEQVVAAATAAHADAFIRALPEGYNTVLNEEASNISQGQMQLLTIARAFLADPAILILDEATSSVDTRTEMQIQAAMRALMKGRTSFVIAHRLSTVRHADVTLVINEGTIIEQGRHDELLDRGGFYAELYNSQFAGGTRPGGKPAAAADAVTGTKVQVVAGATVV
ncbi:MAG: ABC transporter ATP-binding protein [Bacillota bacterium]|nr:ABC transporter ATP-binding protein [Bacillota bacterium]